MNEQMSIRETGQCKRFFAEEEWIDWLLGRKTPQQAETMRRHLNDCPACRRVVEAWEPLLAVEAAEAGERNDAPIPSEIARRKLRARVVAMGWSKRAARSLRNHRKKAIAGAAALILGICLAGLYPNGTQPSTEQDNYVALHEPGAVSLVNDPNTFGYPIKPDNLGEGYVWFNVDSREMFVLIDGLLPSDGYVIQAWAVDGSAHRNLGLLRQFELAKAHLYVKGSALAEVDNVALTIEPTGGSAAPTSPDAVLVRLKR